jgi:hypothetical protein
VPMCGVMADAELFNQFAAMQVTAQALAGVPSCPTAKWSEISALVTSTLFATFPTTPTATGAKYLSVVKNITGGERPLFAQGIAFGGSFPSAYGTFGSDGTINGILTQTGLDTNAYSYVIDGDAAGSTALNASVQKLTAAPDATRRPIAVACNVIAPHWSLPCGQAITASCDAARADVADIVADPRG